MERCSNCGAIKPSQDFYKDGRKKNGLKSECKKCNKLYTDQWCEKKYGGRKQYNHQYRQQLKIECLLEYGGLFCNCCQEKQLEFLSLDHKNGGGNKERLEREEHIYTYLRRNHYPDKKKYQVLYMNCQFGRKNNNGICPHKLSCLK